MTAAVEFGIKINVSGGQNGAADINKITDATVRVGATAESTSQRMSAAQKELGNTTAQLTVGQLKFLDSLRDQATAAGLTRTELLKLQAAELGISQAAAEHIRQIEAANDAHHKFSLATAGSTRELMVLAHEAGTGNFSRLGGSMMVLANQTGLAQLAFSGAGLAIIGAAAAVIGLVAAAAKGHEEMVAMNNALAVTSNYAGQTRAGIDAIAESMTKTKEVTIGHAKEIVTELAASGRIGQQAIAQVAQLASDFAKATGKDIDKIAPELVKLFSDPAKGAEELNRSMHFLTVTDLEHIATLERLGQVQEAQQYLAEKLTAHLPKQVENLGDAAKAWNTVADAISRVKESLKDFGKDFTAQEQIDAIKERQKSIADSFNWAARGLSREQALDRRKQAMETINDLQKQIDGLQGTADAEKKAADASAEVARANQLQAQSWDAIKKSSQLYRAQELQDQLELVRQNKPENDNQLAQKLDAERRIGKEIQDLYRSMGAEGRQLAQEQAASDKQLAENRIKGEEDQIQTELALGKISQEQFDLKMTNVKLEENAAQQEYERQLLRIGGLSKTEEKAIKDKLKLLQAQWNLIEQQGIDKQLVDEKKAYDDIVKSVIGVGDADLKRLNDAIAAQKLHNDEIGKTAAEKELVKRRIEEETTAQLESDAAFLQSLLDTQTFDEKSRAVYEMRLKFLNEEIAKRKELAGLMDRGAALEAEAAAAKQAAEEWKRTSDKVENDLYSAIVDGGGKGYKKLIHDMEVDFAKMVLRPIIQPISNSIATIFTGTNANGVSSSGGNGNLLSNAYSIYNNGTNAASLYNDAMGLIGGAGIMGAIGASGVTAGTLGAAEGLSLVGTGSGLGFTAGAAGAAEGLSLAGTGTGLGFTAAAGTAEAATAGTAIASAGGATAAGGLSAGLAAIPGWGWAALGAAALLGGSGLFDDGPVEDSYLNFKSNNTKGNISINAHGNEGHNDSYYVGNYGTGAFGTFGVDQGYYMSVDQPVVQSFIQTVAATDNALAKLLTTTEQADVTNYLASKSSGYRANTGVEHSNPNANGQLDQIFIQRISDVLDGVESGLSKLVDSFKGTSQQLATEAEALLAERQHLAEYSKIFGENVTLQSIAALKTDSETASQAISRLASIFQTTDSVAISLGKDMSTAFGAVGLASDSARERLVNLAGGLNNLQNEASFFSQNFLSESEQIAPTIKDVTDKMTTLGYANVTTKEQFADLVKGLDLATESGAELYAKLMAIAPEFAQAADYTKKLADEAIANAQQSAAQAEQERQRAITDARNAVADAYNRESSALQNTIDKFTAFSKSLRDFRDSLRAGTLSPLSPIQKYQELKDRFEQTYSLAKAGDPAALEQLQGVAQEFLQASQAVNASSEAYAQDFARVSAALEASAKSADVAADYAASQLTALQQSVSGIVQVNNSVLSVRDAIVQYFNAGGTRDMAVNTASSGAASVTSPIVNGAHTGVGDSGYRLATDGSGATLYFPGGGSHHVDGANAASLLTSTYGLNGGGANGTLVRTRAKGGYTPTGLTLVGEEGPELINFDRPGMVYNAGHTRDILAGTDARKGDSEELQRQTAAIERQTEAIERLIAAVESGQSKSADDMRGMLQHLTHAISRKKVPA